MKSIRRRLTLGLLTGFTLLLGAGGALIYLAARHALYHEFDSRLKVKLLALAALTKPGRDKVEFELPQKLRPVEGATNVVAYYQLFAADGASLVRSPALGEADLPRRFGTLTEPVFWNLILPDGTPGRALGARFVARAPPPKEKKPAPGDKAEPKPPPPPPVEVALVLAEDRSHLEETLELVATVVLSAGGITLLVAMGLIALVLRGCMKPLRRLAMQTERMDATSLGARFPTDGLPVELAPIVHRLNDLLGRLENSFERERRFSADLAHELRTPLAGLRATAEVALKYPGSSERETLQDVLTITRQMEDMVTRLLALARAEQKSIPVEAQPVAVAPLVESVWQPLREKAAARSLTTQFKIPDDGRIESDPTLLRGILVNLMTNAVDYTPPGGRIRVGFTADAGRFVLAVSNTVDELQPTDLPHLFQRFWRKDRARSNDEHLGLGLSLAHSFAALLGLDLTAELRPPGETDASPARPHLSSHALELSLALRGPVRASATAI